MTQLVSPKAVAKSIGVSESSLKRWCDQGLIRSSKTPGGHRRIQIGDVLHFLRQSGRPLARADLIGLPAGIGAGGENARSAKQTLREALSAGSDSDSRRVILDQFVSGVSVVTLCEDLLTPAMHEIGHQWETGCVEIFEERLACNIAGRILTELRQLLPEPAEDAPLAMGAAPAGDHYTLAVQMVELSLRDAGWRASSLGVDLPLDTIEAAIEKHQPRIFWLSMTRVWERDEFDAALSRLTAKMVEGGRIVVGGRAVEELNPQPVDGVSVCRRLTDLNTIVEELCPPAR